MEVIHSYPSPRNGLGPSIKYLTLFLVNFDPLPLPHFVTHPGTPKVRHTSRNPRFLVGLVQKTRTKAPVQFLSQLFAGVLFGDFVRGSFAWKVLCGVFFIRSPFCQNTSV